MEIVSDASMLAADTRAHATRGARVDATRDARANASCRGGARELELPPHPGGGEVEWLVEIDASRGSSGTLELFHP